MTGLHFHITCSYPKVKVSCYIGCLNDKYCRFDHYCNLTHECESIKCLPINNTAYFADHAEPKQTFKLGEKSALVGYNGYIYRMRDINAKILTRVNAVCTVIEDGVHRHGVWALEDSGEVVQPFSEGSEGLMQCCNQEIDTFTVSRMLQWFRMLGRVWSVQQG